MLIQNRLRIDEINDPKPHLEHHHHDFHQHQTDKKAVEDKEVVHNGQLQDVHQFADHQSHQRYRILPINNTWFD